MILVMREDDVELVGIPRESGDDPDDIIHIPQGRVYSPRERG